MHASFGRLFVGGGLFCFVLAPKCPLPVCVCICARGCEQGNAMCGFNAMDGYEGFDKPGQVPAPSGSAQDITVTFSDLNLVGPISVYDIWAQQVPRSRMWDQVCMYV